MVADLTWDIHLSDVQVWQREQIILQVTVDAPDPFALLKADKLVIPNMEVIALPARRDKKNDGTEQLSMRWQLYPHTSGKQSIQLPLMRYYLNGGTRKKWFPPLQSIEVQALPPYFPPTLPVGEVSINSHIVPNGILQPDSLAYWHISLHSTIVTTAQFPPLLKQLRATDGLEVFPAKISINTDKATGKFRLDYRIPIKPKSSGRLDLPDLQWHWFDPQTARLEKAHYEPLRPWVLALWQQILLWLISGLSLLAGGYQLLKWSGYYYRRWWRKYQVLQQLKQPINDTLLHKTRVAWAIEQGLSDNLSIRQWLAKWQQCYGENQGLQRALLDDEERRFNKKR